MLELKFIVIILLIILKQNQTKLLIIMKFMVNEFLRLKIDFKVK